MLKSVDSLSDVEVEKLHWINTLSAATRLRYTSSVSALVRSTFDRHLKTIMNPGGMVFQQPFEDKDTKNPISLGGGIGQECLFNSTERCEPTLCKQRITNLIAALEPADDCFINDWNHLNFTEEHRLTDQIYIPRIMDRAYEMVARDICVKSVEDRHKTPDPLWI